jgi:hypothetical protein
VFAVFSFGSVNTWSILALLGFFRGRGTVRGYHLCILTVD